MNREKCVVCVKEKMDDSYCWHNIEEKLDLELVQGFDDPNSSYTFDMFKIWKRKSDGALFYGRDSGCSCPTPFERVMTCDDLNSITEDGFESFKADFQAYASQKSEPYNEQYTEKIGPRWINLSTETETIDEVRNLLKKVEAK